MTKTNKRIFSALLFIISVMVNCSPSERTTDSDQRTAMRFDQYYVQGKLLYLKHCANCHGESGEGLKQLIPPVAQSNYLLLDIGKAVCIISKGLEGEIEVNGIKFRQPMPPHTDLRFIEIAEIITYITNSWGASSGIFSVKEVEQLSNGCN